MFLVAPLLAVAPAAVFHPADYPAPTADQSIQQAIDAAAVHGGTVELAPQHYRITQPLVIDQHVTIKGAGWTAGQYKGTLLHNVNPDSPIIEIDGPTANGTVIKDLALFQDQPDISTDDWQPFNSPHAITIDSADDVLLENLMLHNVSRGVYGFKAGRLSVSRMVGQPLIEGIRMEAIYDVPRFRDIHFWPFWSYQPNVAQWVNENATAFVMGRVDNPQFSDIFAYGYHRGIAFEQSEYGVTSRFKLSNVEFDLTGIGLLVSGDHITGQASNFSVHGYDVPGSVGIYVRGKKNQVQFANARVSFPAGNAVRVEGDRSSVVLTGAVIDDWDRSKKGFPAFEEHGSSEIRSYATTFNGSRRKTGGRVDLR